MALKKRKCPVKRNASKIKSKVNVSKRGLKSMSKRKLTDKSIENLKWLNDVPPDGTGKECGTVPKWIAPGRSHRKEIPLYPGSDFSDDSFDYSLDESEVTTDHSEDYEKCKCSLNMCPGAATYGILKRNFSSTNSLVAKYIKSGMDQVASFIVESAIRFGKQHGVVVPDKTSPDVYELVPSNRPFDENNRKIRFKIPEKSLAYEDAKKVMWRSQARGKDDDKYECVLKNGCSESSMSCVSRNDSLEEMLPLLEKLKDDGHLTRGDFNLKTLSRSKRKKQRNKKKVKPRQKCKTPGKICNPKKDGRYDKISDWKKFQRDSIELGRERLKGGPYSRKSKK